jgi:tRNA A37 threonylcarbamoyladenosine dehydratase
MEVQQMLAVKKGQDEMVTSSFRTCDGALGTACFVTGTYGFVAASKVVEMIAMDQLVVPKKRTRQ